MYSPASVFSAYPGTRAKSPFERKERCRAIAARNKNGCAARRVGARSGGRQTPAGWAPDRLAESKRRGSMPSVGKGERIFLNGVALVFKQHHNHRDGAEHCLGNRARENRPAVPHSRRNGSRNCPAPMSAPHSARARMRACGRRQNPAESHSGNNEKRNRRERRPDPSPAANTWERLRLRERAARKVRVNAYRSERSRPSTIALSYHFS